jgi:hypothetical protein
MLKKKPVSHLFYIQQQVEIWKEINNMKKKHFIITTKKERNKRDLKKGEKTPPKNDAIKRSRKYEIIKK